MKRADGPSPSGAGCVAAYLRLPRDPAKAAARREKLRAFQRTLGAPAAVYEEQLQDGRTRPKRRRLVMRALRGEVCCVAVLELRDLTADRVRAARLVVRMGVPVVAPDLRLDPSDPVVQWLARDRRDRRRSITEALAEKRSRGERTGQIPSGFRLAADGLHLEPDPEVQRAMATSRDLAAAGMSHQQIAERLTRDGYCSQRGGPISRRTIGRWLAVVSTVG